MKNTLDEIQQEKNSTEEDHLDNADVKMSIDDIDKLKLYIKLMYNNCTSLLDEYGENLEELDSPGDLKNILQNLSDLKKDIEECHSNWKTIREIIEFENKFF